MENRNYDESFPFAASLYDLCEKPAAAGLNRLEYKCDRCFDTGCKCGGVGVDCEGGCCSCKTAEMIRSGLVTGECKQCYRKTNLYDGMCSKCYYVFLREILGFDDDLATRRIETIFTCEEVDS